MLSVGVTWVRGEMFPVVHSFPRGVTLKKGTCVSMDNFQNMTEEAMKDAALLVSILRANPGASTWREIRNWYEAFGNASKLLTDDAPELFRGTYNAHPVKEHPSAADVLEELQTLRHLSTQGVRLLTTVDEEYPQNLKTVFDRPPFLYLKGSVPSHPRCVAVVGSRDASEEGLEYSKRLSRHLSQHGYCVVSGLAAGVDKAAHVSALDAEGDTVAVIGTGIDGYYPKENRELQDRISAKGAVLTQFFPGTPVQRHNFPMRNLVMSGIALATVVVEANEKSGTRSQARGALKHGRKVFFTKFALKKASWAREMLGQPGVFVIEKPSDLYGPLDDTLDSSEAEFEQLALSF